MQFLWSRAAISAGSAVLQPPQKQVRRHRGPPKRPGPAVRRRRRQAAHPALIPAPARRLDGSFSNVPISSRLLRAGTSAEFFPRLQQLGSPSTPQLPFPILALARSCGFAAGLSQLGRREKNASLEPKILRCFGDKTASMCADVWYGARKQKLVRPEQEQM